MNEALKTFLLLTTVTTVCGALLGGVRKLSSDAIVQQEIRYKKGPAIRAVLGAGSHDPVSDIKEVAVADTHLVLFLERENNTVTAAAIETGAIGYGGALSIITGFEVATGTCKGVAVATASETPGIGTRVAEGSFLQQFAGLPLTTEAKLKKDGGTIDAVSGATVSSSAVCKAVARAQHYYSLVHTEELLGQ